MTSSWCSFGAGILSFARLPWVMVWSLEISVVSRGPDRFSIRSLTEYLSSAFSSCASDGFVIIGIPSSSAQSEHTLIISALKIPSSSFVSSEVFLHIAHRMF